MKKWLVMGMLMALLNSTTPAQHPEPLPFPVSLNHFFVVLDSATFREIQNSAFLRNEFAPSEERTTVRKDLTYTGLYFYGVNTYFEFFDVAQERTRKIGDSAIAFGVEQVGASKILADRAKAELPMLITPITRQLGDAQVSWFFMMRPKASALQSGISTWTMEYDEQFLARWHNEIADRQTGITRKAILHRYAAVLKDAPAKPVLQDVLAITLATDSATEDLLIKQGKLFGYGLRFEGAATILQSRDFTLRLIPESASQHGIQQVTLRVNRQPDNQREYRFGAKSVLKFTGDGSATWSF